MKLAFDLYFVIILMRPLVRAVFRRRRRRRRHPISSRAFGNLPPARPVPLTLFTLFCAARYYYYCCCYLYLFVFGRRRASDTSNRAVYASRVARDKLVG